MKKIETIHLFPEITRELLGLLRELEISEWERQSLVKDRTVKDLVSHLIDGSLRRLSLQRDNYSDTSRNINIKSYSDLVDFIQGLNKEWILATRRLSPKILIGLFEYSENQLYNYLKKLDPDDKAIFSVAWAGETESKN